MDAYKLVYKLLVHPVRAFFRITVTGEENLPHDGKGYILTSNHTSLLDALIIEASVDRQVKFMAKKEVFSVPVIGRVVRACGAFPVNRGGADVESIKTTVRLLEGGDTVGIFPQGTRHPGEDPRKTEVRHGVGLIAYRAKCGMIPVYIKTKKNKVAFFRKTEFIIGKPLSYEDLGFTDGGIAQYRNAANLVFDRICALSETQNND